MTHPRSVHSYSSLLLSSLELNDTKSLCASNKAIDPIVAGSKALRQSGRGLLHRNVKRFQGGLVFKVHRLLYHSTLDLRVIKKKREEGSEALPQSGWGQVCESGPLRAHNLGFRTVE